MRRVRRRKEPPCHPCTPAIHPYIAPTMLDLTNDPFSSSDDITPPRPADPQNTDDTLLDAYSRAVISTTERVGPAVVRVETGARNGSRERGGLGSGIVISPDGLVLTNSHVVGASKDIRLRSNEGFVTDARILGTDPDTDLALLRGLAARSSNTHFSATRNPSSAASSSSPSATPLASIDRHRRRRLRARPLFRSVSGRLIDDVIQTDAAPTPATPAARCVVRRQSHRHQHRRHPGAQGICFAVAINTANACRGAHPPRPRPRAYIGVSAQTAPIPRRHAVVAGIDNTMGALLMQLDPNGSASRKPASSPATSSSNSTA